ncbi:glycosyltransferase family 2 protein [Christiangramia salexigens]|uniref:Glycosyl transferase n=1 Tax=Christiangramia salexigens TaxID=1913577 RepID=A0A1L3J5N5_9FLAO|nr:glycosyltransferase family 2 protein [Christiangramia salexigens]APG60422.1 glycosyl transferase [Christiangramia salexigens]
MKYLNKPSLAAIILTYNEGIHLERCLKSVSKVCSEIIIIDSYSTDSTKQIALNYSAKFYQNSWINYSSQFNWGLDNAEINSEWILRIDADEYLTDKLIENIQTNLPEIKSHYTGIMVNRLMYFMGKPLKRGGMYPIRHLKIWRKGKAICEQRWMDERMKLLNGDITFLEGDLIDHNLNNLTWWIQKHNGYATREAIDILDKKFNFTDFIVLRSSLMGNSEEQRRWLKGIYLDLPLFVRPFVFWFVRYFIQLGLLEGKRGFIWNLLQCGWYRFLVDAKIYEAYNKVGKNRENLIQYFKDEFDYDVTKIG